MILFFKGELNLIDVALLGTGGMVPLPNRFLTALYCRIKGRYILIDCGEGTQIALNILGWGIKNLDVICFTHFHADHISGLPGLLLTLGNSGRTEKIYIIGPNGIKKIIRSLCVIAPEIPFEIKIFEQDDLKQNFFKLKNQDFIINFLRVEHSIDCLAYNIFLPRRGKFNLKKATDLKIPKKFWSVLQSGKKVLHNGRVFLPKDVLGEDRRGIKISYCTDTRPISDLINFVHDSDLFICEGIYGEENKKDKAISKKHMIFSEAANLAKKSNSKELWLTHFSPAMPDPKNYLDHAKNIFENTIIPDDGMYKKFIFRN